MFDLHNISQDGRRTMLANWRGQYARAKNDTDREIVRVKFHDATSTMVPLLNPITKVPFLDKEGKPKMVQVNPMFNARFSKLLATTRPAGGRASVDIAFEMLLDSVFLGTPVVHKAKGSRGVKRFVKRSVAVTS